jgi:beta-phosphoglucomutase-like phosphatase (HAD superfamily)
VLFDLDGVLTATAKVHAACWKQAFDEFLQRRAAKNKETFRPSISKLIMKIMSMANPATMASAVF